MKSDTRAHSVGRMNVVDGKWPRWSADAGLAALALLPPLLSQPYVDTSGPAWASLIGYEAVAVVVLVLRRRVPVTAFVAGLGALVAALVTSAGEGGKLTPLVFVPLAVLLYNLGSRYTSWLRTGSALLGGGVMVLVGLWVNWMTVGASELRGGLDVFAALAPMPLAWAMGFAARSRRALLVAAEQRAVEAGRAQRLEAAQATQRERARIAREMHDVVAHSLTLLVVHAETLRARGDELPDWARAQVDGLAAAGRQSSGELRDLLRMLRDPAEAAPLQPVPGLGELGALLDSHRAAGGERSRCGWGRRRPRWSRCRLRCRRRGTASCRKRWPTPAVTRPARRSGSPSTAQPADCGARWRTAAGCGAARPVRGSGSAWSACVSGWTRWVAN